MKSRIKSLSGFEKEREEIKALSRLIFETKKKDVHECLQFLDLNGNVLLYGRPGTGKTSICYACMLETPSASFYQVNCSALISEKLGKTQKLIDELFKEVIDEAKKYPTYLLIEEIETFLPNRDGSKDLEDMKRALTVFMHYMEREIPNLMIFCTTNYIQNLDPAIIRRFSYKFEVLNPNEIAVNEFLTNKDNPFNCYFTDEVINKKIAYKVVENNMTFADLKNIMRKLFLEKQDIGQVNGTALLSKLKEE